MVLIKAKPHNSQESSACKHLSQKERRKNYGVWNSQIHKRWDILDDQKDIAINQKEIIYYNEGSILIKGDPNPKKNLT